MLSWEMKAGYLFKLNVEALLRQRGHTHHDLAQWCHRTDAWLSKILGKDDRNLPLKYIDRIADFFGLETYQLFAPGITPLTERRHAKRRVLKDRRMAAAVENEIPAADRRALDQLNALTVDERRRVESWLVATLHGRATTPARSGQDVPVQSGTQPHGRGHRTEKQKAETHKDRR